MSILRSTVLCVLLPILVLVFVVPSTPAAAQRPGQAPRILWLGLSCDPEHERGFLIDGLTRGGPAERAGLRMGVFITHINGTDVTTGYNSSTWPRAFNASQQGQEIDITYLYRGRSRDARLVTDIMPPEHAQTVQWINEEFGPAFNTYITARNNNDLAGMRSARGPLERLCQEERARINNGFRAQDEFYHNWIMAMGFMGRRERQRLEDAFEDVSDVRASRGEEPPAYRSVKIRIAWALGAMADPDTDLDIIKALVSSSDPNLTRYGAQLIASIFEWLEDEGDTREARRLAEDLVEEEILPPLGEPGLDTNLATYAEQLQGVQAQGVDPWNDAQMAQVAQSQPDAYNAIMQMRFYIDRARDHARAIGYIPARLSISYLCRIRSNASIEHVRQACDDGLQRLFPDRPNLDYEWYRDNYEYMYWDDDDRCWHFSEEAAAAGIPYEEWLEQQEDD